MNKSTKSTKANNANRANHANHSKRVSNKSNKANKANKQSATKSTKPKTVRWSRAIAIDRDNRVVHTRNQSNTHNANNVRKSFTKSRLDIVVKHRRKWLVRILNQIKQKLWNDY